MLKILLSIVICVSLVIANHAQTTEFTYQGNLTISGAPANGNFDLEFAIFDALNAGSQFGSTVSRNGVVVKNGAFAVKLDFGNQFPGANRYLEIRVRNAGGGSFTTLVPRQQINSSPYSIKSTSAENAATAATAANALQLGGVAANQYVVTTDPRMSDARTPTAGSDNYIRNSTVQQPANFNVSGNGFIGGSLDVMSRSRFRQNIGNTGGNNSAGFWFYQNMPATDRAFVGMIDDDGVGFYGNNGGGWGLVMKTQSGNVGIGTTSPTAKLDVSGTGGVRANVNSDINGGLGLSLNNAPKWSVATVSPGQFQIFNDAIGQNAVWIDPTNNNVGLGSVPTSAKLEVNGYTKLGSDAPAIRVKKLTGTTQAFEGSEVAIPTGLDSEKILSISVLVRSNDPTIWIDANSPLNGARYFWYLFAGDIRVVTVAGGSAQILSKPIKILVTYEQ